MTGSAPDDVSAWIAAAEAAAAAARAKAPQGRDRFWQALVEALAPKVHAARTLEHREQITAAVSWALAGALHGFGEAVAVRALNGEADAERLADALLALALTIEKLDERDVLISAGRVYEAILDRHLDGGAIIARAQSFAGGPAEAFLGRFARRPSEMRGAAIGGDMIVGPPGDRRFVSASLFPERPPR